MTLKKTINVPINIPIIINVINITTAIFSLSRDIKIDAIAAHIITPNNPPIQTAMTLNMKNTVFFGIIPW